MTRRLAVLVVVAGLPWSAARAQDEWEANKGDCERVLRRAKLKQLERLSSCVELWETYRDASDLRPEEKRAVAKGFSVVLYKGDTTGRMLAKSALGKMGMRPLPEDEVLPRKAAKPARPAETPKYYPEVSRKRQREAEKLTAKGLKYHRKKTRKAVGLYERAMRADPNYLKAHYNAACAYAKLGDVRNAIEVLEEM